MTMTAARGPPPWGHAVRLQLRFAPRRVATVEKGASVALCSALSSRHHPHAPGSCSSTLGPPRTRTWCHPSDCPTLRTPLTIPRRVSSPHPTHATTEDVSENRIHAGLPMNSDEALRMEYKAHLEEFSALRMEILASLDSARQVIGLTLTAIGALLVAVPFVLERKATVVFLLAPFLFCALSWTRLRHTFLVLDIGTYLREALIPRMRQVVTSVSGGLERADHILGWEYWGASLPSSSRTRLDRVRIFPVVRANDVVPVLASVGSVAAYFLSGQIILDRVTIPLLVLDVLLVAYTWHLGGIAETRLGHHKADTIFLADHPRSEAARVERHPLRRLD